jgi:hypothetical protein
MDERLAKRLKMFQAGLDEKKTVVIQHLSKNHKEEMGYYRLLSNTALTEQDISEGIYSKIQKAVLGSHILVLSDTTDIDYSSQRGRITPNSGLGYIGNGKGLGYNAHVSLCIDAKTEAIYGFSDVQLWDRPLEHTPYRQIVKAEKERGVLIGKQKSGIELSKEEQDRLSFLRGYSIEIEGVVYTSSSQIPLECKESYRWVTCCENSIKVLKAATKITFIQDREGDIYETFSTIPSEKADLLIRSKHNRDIFTKSGKKAALHEYRHELPELGRREITIRDRVDGKERKAIISLKSDIISIKRGRVSAMSDKKSKKQVEVTVVYAEEVSETVPEGRKPIFWCLITTHQVHDTDSVFNITYWYSLRWGIEVLFRLIKKDGFKLESSQLETGYALRKLGILTMEAAVKVLQLKQARDGDETLPIEVVFSDQEIKCLESIVPTLEGQTEKLKNPHDKKTLPWASWIIARLGGWKGYKNKRPPGVLILRSGLDKFKLICLGFELIAPA